MSRYNLHWKDVLSRSFAQTADLFVLPIRTIGIEIVDDVPDVDAVVVPVGGAGLIAGVSCAVKTLKPECKVSTKRNMNRSSRWPDGC